MVRASCGEHRIRPAITYLAKALIVASYSCNIRRVMYGLGGGYAVRTPGGLTRCRSFSASTTARVLSPKIAVAWAAFFNFAAAFLLGTAVAKTIGKGMIRLDIVTQYVVIAGLAGAIVWDLLIWWWGLPTSSSHALIGGYAGAAMARAAFLYGPSTALDVIIAMDEDAHFHRCRTKCLRG